MKVKTLTCKTLVYVPESRLQGTPAVAYHIRQLIAQAGGATAYPATGVWQYEDEPLLDEKVEPFEFWSAAPLDVTPLVEALLEVGEQEVMVVTSTVFGQERAYLYSNE